MAVQTDCTIPPGPIMPPNIPPPPTPVTPTAAQGEQQPHTSTDTVIRDDASIQVDTTVETRNAHSQNPPKDENCTQTDVIPKTDSESQTKTRLVIDRESQTTNDYFLQRSTQTCPTNMRSQQSQCDPTTSEAWTMCQEETQAYPGTQHMSLQLSQMELVHVGDSFPQEVASCSNTVPEPNPNVEEEHVDSNANMNEQLIENQNKQLCSILNEESTDQVIMQNPEQGQSADIAPEVNDVTGNIQATVSLLSIPEVGQVEEIESTENIDSEENVQDQVLTELRRSARNK